MCWAIEDALARGEESYDFLMADSAGTRSISPMPQTPMNWITMGPDRLASRLEKPGLHRIEVSLKQWRRKMEGTGAECDVVNTVKLGN